VPSPIRAALPIYTTASPNADIVLSTEPVRLGPPEDGAAGTATLTLRFLPSPRLRVSGEYGGGAIELVDRIQASNKTSLTFTNRGITADVLLSSYTFFREPMPITATVLPGTVDLGDAQALRHVIFHLINYKDFVVPLASHSLSMQAVLEAAGWRVTLSPVPRLAGLMAELRDNGGYAVTHAGRLERLGGEDFTVDSGKLVLDGLHYFLSFARGTWSGPCLPVGFDSEGIRCWEQWGIPNTSSFLNPSTWFDPHNGQLLSEVFPGFHELWADPLWTPILRRAIFWYVMSNKGEGGVGAVILSQTALELLAWFVLVRTTRELSAREFRSLKAAGRLRRLLRHFRIPCQVPGILRQLINASIATQPWHDGPHALTVVRNNLVHPVPTSDATSVDHLAQYEAWLLAQWYLELCLLALFNHSRSYSNRMNWDRQVGQVEPVPWMVHGPSDRCADPPSESATEGSTL